MYIKTIHSVSRVHSKEGTFEVSKPYRGIKNISPIQLEKIRTNEGFNAKFRATQLCVDTARSVLEGIKIDSIVVASGLSMIETTNIFIENIKNRPHLLSPSAFIYSVSNTLSGEIAIQFNIKGYNMMHTHGSFSFESALIDANMLLLETAKNVLVGGFDEYPSVVSEIKGTDDIDMSEGSTFMVLSKHCDDSMAEINYLGVINADFAHEEKALTQFFQENNITPDCLYYGFSTIMNQRNFEGINYDVVYSDFCGLYMTNVAFGIHLAVEDIKVKEIDSILVINRFDHNKIALTLIKGIN
jgi:hypothetical protein